MSTQRLRNLARRWLAAGLGLAIVAAGMLIPVSAVAAEPTDMVLQWNANALATISNPPTAATPGLGQPPPAAPIQLAIVHGAIYDAVSSIDGTRQPYLGALSAPGSASMAAAVATAAHDALLGIVPAANAAVVASVDAMYAASLASIPAGTARTAGISVGAAAARAMLADRATDGRFGSHTFTVGIQPGEWRLVPPLNANAFAWVALVKPFAMKSSDQFRTEAPPALTSDRYTAEFNEVKAIGAQTGSTRTDEQAALAAFVSVSPVGIDNKALRDLAIGHGLSTAEQARLFAMTSMSAADALIGCWNNKDYWSFWRPQTAIREAATDGNPATIADAEWSSMIPNPGYPDMPSGYNCFTAGTMSAARAFFGTDHVALDLTNAAAIPPVTRHYDRFSAVIDDAIDGRIYVGLHFRSADEAGAWIGKKAAQWLARHEFGPVN
jgi:hypothetical protein